MASRAGHGPVATPVAGTSRRAGCSPRPCGVRGHLVEGVGGGGVRRIWWCVGVWGLGPLVMLHVRALIVGGGGCVWVKCPCGGSGPTLGAGCWAGVGARGGWCGCPPLLLWYTTLLCSAVLVCCVLSCAGEFHCVPLPAVACYAALCAALPP